MTDRLIALPDDCEPRVEWMTRVVYPAGHRSRMAGETIEFAAGESQDLAERRRAAHLARGAETADVMRRVWTPTQWERVD